MTTKMLVICLSLMNKVDEKMKITLLRILFSTALSVVLGWTFFIAGYYMASTQVERDKIELVRGDIKFMKHIAAELEDSNSAVASNKLQDMLKFKEFYLETTYRALDEFTFFNFAFHPLSTIQLIASRSGESEGGVNSEVQ